MDLNLTTEVKKIIKENVDKLDTNEFSEVLYEIYNTTGQRLDLIKVLFWLLKIQVDPLDVCKSLTIEGLFGEQDAIKSYGRLIQTFFDDYFKVFPRRRNLKISGDGVVFELQLLNYMKSIYSISFNSCRVDSTSVVNNNSLYSFTVDSNTEIFGSNKIKFGSCGELAEIITPQEVNFITINCPKFKPAGKITGNIKPGQFYNNSQIQNLVIDDSTEVIGSMAFYGCPSLKQVTLGNNVKIIGASAFANCLKLTSIIIPENVISIQRGAFQGSGLSSVTFKGNPRIEDQVLDVADIENLTVYCDKTATNVISALTALSNLYIPSQGEFNFESQVNFI